MLDAIHLHLLREYLRSQQITEPAEVERIERECKFLAKVKGITDPAELLRRVKEFQASGIGKVVQNAYLWGGDQVIYWFREATRLREGTGRELPLGPADPALREYIHAVHPDMDFEEMTAPEVAAILRADCTEGRTLNAQPMRNDLPRVAYFRDCDGCPYEVDPSELRHLRQTETEVFGLWPRRRPEHHDTWVVLPLKGGVGRALNDNEAFDWCTANHQELPEPLKEKILSPEDRPTTTRGPVVTTMPDAVMPARTGQTEATAESNTAPATAKTTAVEAAMSAPAPSAPPSEPARTVTIKGDSIVIYPPPLELWGELNALEKDTDGARVYPWGWAFKVLDAVTRHCAGRELDGHPGERTILLLSVLATWDKSYWHVAARKGFVMNALGLYLVGCIQTELRLKLVREPHPELADAAKKAGFESSARLLGLIGEQASADSPPRPAPTEEDVWHLARLAVGMKWTATPKKIARSELKNLHLTSNEPGGDYLPTPGEPIEAPPITDPLADQYVTLDQAAALVNRSKKTLERYLHQPKSEAARMPEPDVEGTGGKPHEWRWIRLRPWLEKTFGRTLPERFPTRHPIPRPTDTDGQ